MLASEFCIQFISSFDSICSDVIMRSVYAPLISSYEIHGISRGYDMLYSQSESENHDKINENLEVLS